MPKISTEIRAMTISGILIGRVASQFELYIKSGTTLHPLTLHDLPSVNSPHSPGGIIELTEGWYRVDIPEEFSTTTPYRVIVIGSVQDGHVISSVIHSVSDATQAEIISEIQKLNLVPASSITEIPNENLLVIHRGDTLIRLFTGLGNLTNIQNIIITGKRSKDLLDDNAIFKVSLNNNLTVINGDSPSSNSNGSLAKVDSSTGIISLYISEKETVKFLDLEDGHFDIQLHYESSVVTKIDGILIVTADVTREI
jgi:hypothetical protein